MLKYFKVPCQPPGVCDNITYRENPGTQVLSMTSTELHNVANDKLLLDSIILIALQKAW